MAYQRFDGTMSFLPSRFEAQAILPEMQKKRDEDMRLLRLKQAEEKKQQTEALRSELNRMLAELRAMTANREATMSKFLSQTSIPPRPPFPPPDPPDLAKLFESPLLHTPAIHPRAPFSPNKNQNNQGLTDEIVFDKDYTACLLNGVVTQQSKIEFEVESIETGSSIQQIESSGVKNVISTDLVLNNESNPEEESRPEEASTHKADSVFGEETITSNASESSQVPSQVSLYHLPVFDGTFPDCWIAKGDRFFELKQYGNEEKLDLISLSLEGAALKWFRRHRREFTDWTDIKRKLMARFGSEKESTDSVEITSIKGHEVQGTTVSHLATSCVDNSVVENQKKLAWKDETPVFEHLHEPSRLFDDESQGILGGSPLERVDEESSGDVKFHLKHKWRSRVLQTLSGLEFCLLPTKLDLRDWPKEESKPHKKKLHQIETFEVLSSLEPSRRSHNEQLGDSDDFPFAIVRTHISQSDLKCVTGIAHRMFDVMPLETKPLKNKKNKALQKTWWFKFKTSLERSILMDDKLSFIEESTEKDITKLGAQQGFKIEVWSGFDLEACIGVITYGWKFKKQFKSEKSPFQRTYAAQIKICEEMARQICFFMDQTSKTRVLAKQMLVKGYDIDLDNVEAGEFFSYAHGSATAPQRGIESQQASEDLLESPWLQGEKCTDSTRQNIIGIIFKELCSAGFERENEIIKKSFKGLSKVEKDHKIEATVLVFLGHTFGKITSGWIKDQKQGAIYEWSLFLQMLQTVKDRKNTNGVTIQVMVQRQWETFVMMLLTIAESLVLLSDQFIFAENKGIEISISCCYGTSSVDMQFSTFFEIMSKQQHFIQLPNLPWESSHADADGILLKMEVLVTPSTQNKVVTKALTQWKEHPPDQFYMALNGRSSIFHS